MQQLTQAFPIYADVQLFAPATFRDCENLHDIRQPEYMTPCIMVANCGKYVRIRGYADPHLPELDRFGDTVYYDVITVPRELKKVGPWSRMIVEQYPTREKYVRPSEAEIVEAVNRMAEQMAVYMRNEWPADYREFKRYVEYDEEAPDAQLLHTLEVCDKIYKQMTTS